MIKERVLKYLDYKGVSKYNFYKKTGISNGALDKKGTFGADKCELIYYQYPDMDIEWLITGNGEMLKSVPSSRGQENVPVASNGSTNECAERIADLKSHLLSKDQSLSDKDEIIFLLKEKNNHLNTLLEEFKKTRRKS